MADVQYPLPFDLATQFEALLEGIDDREDTVFRIREFAGRIYAQGHQDGRILALYRASTDRRVIQQRNRADNHEGASDGNA